MTVGTHSQGFVRLISKMDEISRELGDAIVMQIGSTPYRPKFAEYFTFVQRGLMEDFIMKADVVVAHAGSGVALSCLNLGKPLVVVPRLRALGEHVDDHQLELAEMLSKRGLGVSVLDIDNLHSAIKQAKSMKPSPLDKGELVEVIIRYTSHFAASHRG